MASAGGGEKSPHPRSERRDAAAAAMPEADPIKLEGEDEPEPEEEGAAPSGHSASAPPAGSFDPSKLETGKERPVAPAHTQEVKTPDGKTAYKLTCPCGKRMLVPAGVKKRTGRCPKCNKLIRIPRPDAGAAGKSPGAGEGGQKEAGASEAIRPKGGAGTEPKTAAPAAAAVADRQPPKLPSVPPPVPFAALPAAAGQVGGMEGWNVNREAAMAAAERLRSRASERVRQEVGVVSAWPRADFSLRGLAAFIDITAMLLVVGIFLLLGTQGALPEWVTRPLMVPILFAALAFLNDAVLQILCGGSIGKKLVILTILRYDGRPPSPHAILLRAATKWALVPGWIWFFFDPDRRAPHDLICGTLVLKGRER